jgi:hypothetical protein
MFHVILSQSDTLVCILLVESDKNKSADIQDFGTSLLLLHPEQ